MKEENKKVVSEKDIPGMLMKELMEKEDFFFSLMGTPRSVLTWHLYAKEKPTRDAEYLVSFVNVSLNLLTTLDRWNGNRFIFHDKDAYAWAEKPNLFMGAKV